MATDLFDTVYIGLYKRGAGSLVDVVGNALRSVHPSRAHLRAQ
jgi:hypothetical protein